MPLSRLYKESHELGANDRDFPTDISPSSCQVLQNAFPGAPNNKPRDGISKWNTNNLGRNILEVIPWSETNNTVITISKNSSGIHEFHTLVKGSGTMTLLFTPDTALHKSTKFTWVRAQTSLYITTDRDSNGQAWIVEESASGFTMRNANITQTPSTNTITAVAQNAIPISGTDQYYRLAWTLIRKDPDITGFYPGELEEIYVKDSFNNNLSVQGTAASEWEVKVQINETIDPQVTHVRIYSTLLGASATITDGLSYRFLADVPIVASGESTEGVTVNETVLTETLPATLDLLKTVGYDPFPSGSFLTAHKASRLWLSAKTADNEFPAQVGRWYHSSNVEDVDYPKKWNSMFRISTDFKDTSLDDQEDGSGMGVHDDDLIFIMERSTVWKLRNGDVTLEPVLISSTKGSKFPKTIVKIDEMLMYLSNEGPCYVEGDAVNTMREFTASEVWPTDWKNDIGYFFQAWDAHDIRSFYFRSTWWIHRGDKIIGMYMPTDQKGFGPMRVAPAWSEIRADRVAVLGYSEAVIIGNHLPETSYAWNFLDQTTKSDNGYNYLIKEVSKGFYVNKVNPDMAGELYDLLVHCVYTDAGKLRIKITTDNDRVLHSVVYDQDNDGSLVDDSNGNTRRNVLQQGFVEGLVGRIFQIEITKEFRYPYDYHSRGFTMRLKKLLDQDFEYQGEVIQADDGIHDALTDDRTISDWEEQGKIKDAGDNDRTYGDYTVRDAGDDTTRLLAE